MAVIARWTITPGHRIRHADGDSSWTMTEVTPDPEFGSEAFEVVSADAYAGAVERAEKAEAMVARWEARFDAWQNWRADEALNHLGGQSDQ